ncbi:MAG: helix-turn-helix domain-containing protein [bacterium]
MLFRVKWFVIPNGVGAQFIAPRNQGVINHAPTEERFLPSVEMTDGTVGMTKLVGRNDKCLRKEIQIMIGQNLKNLREKNNLSQVVLAKKLGVSRQAVCMWESGKREFGISTLVKIADIFDVSIDEIVRPGYKRKTCPKLDSRFRGNDGEIRGNDRKSIVFELNAPSVNEVLLIGDFNSWNTSGIQLKKDKTGLWKLELELKPGKYEYKFIVDGKWQNDPVNTNTVLNSYGTTNSVKEII